MNIRIIFAYLIKGFFIFASVPVDEVDAFFVKIFYSHFNGSVIIDSLFIIDVDIVDGLYS
ncbi:hypothetical protein THFILI_00045 [Thermus filiformis]|uniref:Uncharacterized protein n=1 Tax=Thermus filiformis TaxID=276 RepID=A0A0D6XD97_THEFI|nr:hypothetical protein THFILI_00045 [Thermus filiformis]